MAMNLIYMQDEDLLKFKNSTKLNFLLLLQFITHIKLTLRSSFKPFLCLSNLFHFLRLAAEFLGKENATVNPEALSIDAF